MLSHSNEVSIDHSLLKQDKSRGSQLNYHHRFSNLRTIPVESSQAQTRIKTEYIEEQCRSIISTNQSPDVPFEHSINPYRGCEHGCIYCFARPSHAYWDLSPGLDFETNIIYKSNAVAELKKKLNNPNYQCKPIALGVNTDAYQPIEEKLQLTRALLEVLLEFRHPVHLLTKSNLVLRDLDIIKELNAHNLISVGISITTLNNHLKTIMEPRAASPKSRLKIMKELSDIKVPVHALIAPIIPGINDHEIEKIVRAVKANGVENISYIMLRLPHELKTIFTDWLELHFPYRKDKVLSYIRDLRGGQLNKSEFGKRMTGCGIFSQIFNARFKLACKKFSMNKEGKDHLSTEHFRNELPTQLPLI
ncbi:PA0069 family radical SAM protein [Pleionea sediminis]|uniref:PA0069 family radical SAM protein n=1 Tax=Pleionea sediminis TaxID=2569479 RepID=UPI001185881A|nr:PA0069 family radical SAM protein [Pleionea sediminis]